MSKDEYGKREFGWYGEVFALHTLTSPDDCAVVVVEPDTKERMTVIWSSQTSHYDIVWGDVRGMRYSKGNIARLPDREKALDHACLELLVKAGRIK